jgi:hypothetical protein
MSDSEKCVPFHLADGVNFSSNPKSDACATEHAAVHWVDREDGVLSAFVVPHDKMLRSVISKNTSNVVRPLERLTAAEKSCNRSTTKKGTSTFRSKCAVFWKHNSQRWTWIC